MNEIANLRDITEYVKIRRVELTVLRRHVKLRSILNLYIHDDHEDELVAN